MFFQHSSIRTLGFLLQLPCQAWRISAALRTSGSRVRLCPPQHTTPFRDLLQYEGSNPQLMFGWKFYHVSAISWMWLSKKFSHVSFKELPSNKISSPKHIDEPESCRGQPSRWRRNERINVSKPLETTRTKTNQLLAVSVPSFWANSFVQTEDGWKDTLFFPNPLRCRKNTNRIAPSIFYITRSYLQHVLCFHMSPIFFQYPSPFEEYGFLCGSP